MGAEIRAFERADHAAARELWLATDGIGVNSADEEPDIAVFLERNPGQSLAAVEGGRLVGTVMVGHDGRRGFIYHLAVAASHRRTGLGARLMREAIAGLGRAGIKKCHVMVFAANASGRGFWQAIGGEFRDDLVVYSFRTRVEG